MQRIRVGIGIDRDGAHAEPLRGARDAAGNLSAIGDQNRCEHEHAGLGAIVAPRRMLSTHGVTYPRRIFQRLPDSLLKTCYCAVVDGAAFPPREAARGVGTGVGAAGAVRRAWRPRPWVRVGSALTGHARLIVHDADRRDRGRGRKIDIHRRRRRRHCRVLGGVRRSAAAAGCGAGLAATAAGADCAASSMSAT